MSLINENIKFLRKQKGWTQEQFANKLGIKRSLVGAYEEGRADPRLSNLLNMSSLFDVSIDTLLTIDLTKGEIASNQNKSLFKVLAITVDHEDNENIDLVPDKAAAGYLRGYADPEYIEELPKFRLPMLPGNSTYRAFEIAGDSMLPLKSGTVIIGKYVESLSGIKDNKTYILITHGEGIVYKRVFRNENHKFELVSDNKLYSPYTIDAKDIIETWEAAAYIGLDFPEPESESDPTLDKLSTMISGMQEELNRLKSRPQ